MSRNRVNKRQLIVQQISIIRTALKQQGYLLRKQPRQDVWTVQISPNKQYRLTYQPSPIASWCLHPLDSDRQTVLDIIQNTLNHPFTHHPEKVL